MNDYSAFLQEDGVAVFLFHGVIEKNRHVVRNYTNKHLARDRFIYILRCLCALGCPVSMGDIVEGSLAGKVLPQRAFAITFDDGFKNNYHIAAPVLRDFRVPATFYVTTHFIEHNASSWIDMIEYAVEKRDTFRLRLPFQQIHSFYVTAEQKRALLKQVRGYVKNEPTLNPYEFAQDIWDQLGFQSMDPDPDLDEKMSWAQLLELSRDPLFTVGGHGHTHRILEYLDQAELEREIAVSMERLRANLDGKIEHYSYPEGLSNCYSERVISVLRGHGIVCVPTAEHGINRIGDDLFHLKRIMVT